MGYPVSQGLYDPRNEHDACGVGMVAHIKGAKKPWHRPSGARDPRKSSIIAAQWARIRCWAMAQGC